VYLFLEECASNKGVNDAAAFSFADLLLGLGASQEMEQASGGPDLRCPKCGFSQADFKKAGRLGCPECYDTFADGLESLLKSMHKGTQHVGKNPSQSSRQTHDLNERLKDLQRKLDQAVASEDFEEAAVVRDEIKLTKNKLAELSTAVPHEHP